MPQYINMERFKDAQQAELQNWAAQTANEHYIRHELCEHAEIVEPLKEITGGRVFEHGLEVGVGPFGLGFLGAHFADWVTAIDGLDPLPRLNMEIAAPELKAEVETIRNRVNYIQSPGEHIPAADASYDIVSCINVVDHGTDPARIVAEINRVLRPRGILVFAVSTLSAVGEAKWRLCRRVHPGQWLYRAHPQTFQWKRADRLIRLVPGRTLWHDKPSLLCRLTGHGRMSFWIRQRL